VMSFCRRLEPGLANSMSGLCLSSHAAVAARGDANGSRAALDLNRFKDAVPQIIRPFKNQFSASSA
jgi:hypothetical protein